MQCVAVIHSLFLGQGYPATVDAIRNEALSDVPPLLRPYVWSALLGVKGEGSSFIVSTSSEYTNYDIGSDLIL